MIPYGRQSIDEADIKAVIEVLGSDWLTQGPAIPRFEEAFKKICAVNEAVACSNATTALHIAYQSLGIGPGSLVWTSPNTFVATANAALYLGASVDFVDIEEESQNLCPKKLAAKLAECRKKGRSLPDLVVPVHFAGRSCDMKSIHELSKEYGFKIVEDASHAVGGTHRGKPIGSCAFSDICIFSFHPVKIITTAEGGMALTNDKELADRMRLLRSHGITRDTAAMKRASEGGWYYEQLDLGYNYRLTDLQAALGLSQLNRLDSFSQRRRELAKRYQNGFAGLPQIRCPKEDPHGLSGWHLFAINFLGPNAKSLREKAYKHLKSEDIHPNVHYIPVPYQPYYTALGFNAENYPVAMAHYKSALSLPLYFGLSDAEQDKVIESLTRFLHDAS